MTSIEQIATVALPWSKQLDLGADAFVVTVMAQRHSGDAGTITCRILVDGVEVQNITSTGPYVITTCSSDLRHLRR